MTPLSHDEDGPISGLMWHYTSVDALASIAEHKTLRATNIHYLNDASESELGLDLIRDIAKGMRGAGDEDAAFLDYVMTWIESRDILSFGAVYVLCFSEVADQLSQWRGYTPHGRGVCVGIGIGDLVASMQRLNDGWTFQRCRYGKESQRRYAAAILKRMRRQAAEGSASGPTHYADVMGRNISDLLQVAAMIKNDRFVDEREVRFISPLIYDSDPRIKFRSGRSTVIPYVDFRLVANSDESVAEATYWIGPSPNQKITHNVVAMLAHRFALSRTSNFRDTEIPYREL